MKKLLILTTITLLSVVSALAQVTWNFTSGKLTIGGTEGIYYMNPNLYPWHEYRESITMIVIENGVTGIGNYAFADCSILSEVILVNGAQVLNFGNNNNTAATVFSNTPLLNTLYLGREIAAGIGNYFSSIINSPFHNKTSLTMLTVGNNVSWGEYSGNSGNYLFYGCSNLDSVKLGSGVKYIGNYAFYNCSALTKILFPESVEEIGIYSFCNSGLNTLNISKNVSFIGSYAFADCSSLTKVKFECGTQSLIFAGNITATTVFSNTPLLSTLYLGREKITAGGNSFSSSINSPFYNNKTLSKLIIEECVATIPNYTFQGCTGLTQITSNRPAPPQIYSNTFSSVLKTIPVNVPEGSKCPYEEAEYWKDFTNIIDGITTDCNVYLVVSPENCNFTANGGNTTININSNQAWYVTSNDLWLTALPPNGNNDDVFTLTATENTTTSIRNTTVTVLGGGITRTINVSQDACVGIENFLVGKLQIYPNPTTRELKIENGELKIENIEIYDIYGRKQLSTFNSQLSTQKIDISHLSAGIYFLKINTEVGQVIKKVLKE